MNAEKATEVVNEVLSKALEAATATGNFVVEQAPDVVQQLLTYKTFEAAAMTTVMVSIAILLCVCSKKLWNWAWANQDDDSAGPAITFSLISGGAAIVPLFVSLLWALDLAKIILAPKIFLIEYAAQLVK